MGASQPITEQALSISMKTCLRLYHITKYMREHHPMRYHRMTEILKTVASVKLSSTFLLKSYFLKKPLPMLVGLYIFNVFAVGYIIYALERNSGTCMEYQVNIQCFRSLRFQKCLGCCLVDGSDHNKSWFW